jgi:hypothetical protein
MVNVCAGGEGRRFVDARFLRPLADRERVELETHLSSCAWCGERYRKLQLAERVASVGVDRALEEPSALEIERIAQDLHLVESTGQSLGWWRALRGSIAGYSAVIAVAAAVAIFFAIRPPKEVLLERGGAAVGVSFSAFVIAADGAIRAHEPAVAVSNTDHLKLRVSWSAAAPRIVYAVVALSDGTVELAELGEPSGAPTGATVPGAISMAKVPAEGAELWVVASDEPLDPEAAKTLAREHGQRFRLLLDPAK